MKVLMTGATGLIGQAVGKELLARQHTLLVASRDIQRARASFPLPAEFVAWDPTEGPIPEAGLDGVQAVVHLAGEPVAARRWSSAQKMRIRESRVLGTRHFWQRLVKMRAQGKALALKTLVAGSAIGFYGDRGEQELTETAGPGGGFLADVCRQWESEIFRPDFSDVRQVAIRTGVVLGNGGGALARLLPLFRVGAGGALGTGRQWMSWIHVGDLARVFADAVENDAFRGPLNGVAPHPVTNREFGKTLARVLGRPAVLPLPAVALRLAMGEMARMVLDSQRVSPDRLNSLGFRFRFEELEAALRDLCARGAHGEVDAGKQVG